MIVDINKNLIVNTFTNLTVDKILFASLNLIETKILIATSSDFISKIIIKLNLK